MRSTAIVLLFSSLLLIFYSCRSKRHVTTINKKETSAPFNTYSKKLGFEVDKNDDLKLIETVVAWLGTPYKYNSCNKNGVDCSCFVQEVYREAYNIALSRSSEEMLKQTHPIKKSHLHPGDLLFFKTEGNKVSHVGIFLKGTKFVHASTKKGVMISDLTEPYFEKTFFKAGRVNK